jgi:hypothetical protein
MSSFPTSLDTFIAVKKKGDTLTESITIPVATGTVSVSVLYPILSDVAVPGFTVTTLDVPPTGYFRPILGTKQIIFGPNNVAQTVSMSYKTAGTFIGDLPIQGMIDAIVAIEATLGTSILGTASSLDERITVTELGQGHTHTYYDLTSQINGSQTAFTLPEVPTNTDGSLVFYNGLPLVPNVDFIWSGATIQLLNITGTDPDIPEVPDTLYCLYIK